MALSGDVLTATGAIVPEPVTARRDGTSLPTPSTTMKILLLIPILFLTSCSLRGVVTTAGEVETITRGSSYIKTGVAVYDHIRPTK